MIDFEYELGLRLAEFNNKYFPSPEFKHKVYTKQIDEDKYGVEKEREFLNIYI